MTQKWKVREERSKNLVVEGIDTKTRTKSDNTHCFGLSCERVLGEKKDDMKDTDEEDEVQGVIFSELKWDNHAK